jgi:hypothetical protein
MFLRLLRFSFYALFFMNGMDATHALATIPEQPTQIFGNFVWHQSYQDQRVNGIVVVTGQMKHLEERYQLIKEVAAKYKRPITVLDIGASQGYYSFRLAEDFKDAVCVMIEEDPYLNRLCALNTELNNVVLLNKRVSIEELERLGECEHFDLVLCLNVIHWSESDWQRMTDAVLKLGDRILIETPPAGDQKAIGGPYLAAIEHYIESHKAKIIGKFPRSHTRPDLMANFYAVTKNKRSTARAYWTAHKGTGCAIKSTLKEKVVIKKSDIVEPLVWQPGINMMTFKALQGTYPTLAMILSSIDSLGSMHKSYKQPVATNLLMQGASIEPLGARNEQACVDFNYVKEVVNNFLTASSDSPVLHS